MEYSDETQEIIINSGAFAYKADVIASLLKTDVLLIEDAMSNDKEFIKLYKFGNDMANYKLDLKLFEMAKSGDIKAMQAFQAKRLINNGEE
jgi:hypothetical protein